MESERDTLILIVYEVWKSKHTIYLFVVMHYCYYYEMTIFSINIYRVFSINSLRKY